MTLTIPEHLAEEPLVIIGPSGSLKLEGGAGLAVVMVNPKLREIDGTDKMAFVVQLPIEHLPVIIRDLQAAAIRNGMIR